MSYTIVGYNAMIADSVRLAAYTRAVEAAVRPGFVVADIGAGSGYFAVLACKLGAKKVYALEPSPVIEIARQVAQDNGCSDRIEFIQQVSTDASLPERVDVIVCDLRGSIPYYGPIVQSVVDLRTRYLKPDGVLIPSRDDLFAVLVDSPRVTKQITPARGESESSPDMTALQDSLRNRRVAVRIEPNEIVTDVRHLGTLDYRSVEEGQFRSRVSWEIKEASVANGICVWFDTKLFDDIGFSNSPSSPKTVYGTTVFPLSEAISLTPGDVVTLEFEGVPIDGEYVFRWATTVSNSGEEFPRVKFRQSTFDVSMASVERMKRRRSDYIPLPGTRHAHLQFVLDRVDGTKSLETIARQLSSAYGKEFPDWMSALTFVANSIEANS